MLPPKDEDQALWSLNMLYGNRDWYSDVGYDQFGRPVLFIKYECQETIWNIPDRWYGKQLLVHFAASAADKKYITVASNSFIPEVKIKQLLQENITPLPAADLHNEIWNLKRVCGIDALIDIFYECHDGDDGITQLSESFPEVRATMERLYKQFGFDALLEELDV
jgi:hypothetical protein